nr:unnamed protein product [Spirometra erinaceieuropaei]
MLKAVTCWRCEVGTAGIFEFRGGGGGCGGGGGGRGYVADLAGWPRDKVFPVGRVGLQALQRSLVAPDLTPLPTRTRVDASSERITRVGEYRVNGVTMMTETALAFCQESLFQMGVEVSCGTVGGSHLGDDEAMVSPSVGTRDDRLCHQHFLLAPPLDANIVQRVPLSEPRVYPGHLLPRRKAEEGVGQDEAELCAGSQVKHTIVIKAPESVGTQHSSPGNTVSINADLEVTEDNQLTHLRHRLQEGVHVL